MPKEGKVFKVPIDKIVPVTNARAKIASLVSEVQRTKSLYVLTRGGKPAAILASIDFISEKTADAPQIVPKEEVLPQSYEKPESMPEPVAVQSTQLSANDANTDTQVAENEEQPVKISIK